MDRLRAESAYPPQSPPGHWKTTTFDGALRLPGMTAPMVLDGPITAEWFLACTEQMLVPTLHPGDVVILDNLPAQKGSAFRNAVETAGSALMVLPPYLPDFNPIENALAKLQMLLCKTDASTVDHFWRVIDNCLDTFRRQRASTTTPPLAMTLTDRKRSSKIYSRLF